jgi:hypothetical protein
VLRAAVLRALMTDRSDLAPATRASRVLHRVNYAKACRNGSSIEANTVSQVD